MLVCHLGYACHQFAIIMLAIPNKRICLDKDVPLPLSSQGYIWQAAIGFPGGTLIVISNEEIYTKLYLWLLIVISMIRSSIFLNNI